MWVSLLFVHEPQYLLRSEDVNVNFLELRREPSIRAKHMKLCAGIWTICRRFESLFVWLIHSRMKNTLTIRHFMLQASKFAEKSDGVLFPVNLCQVFVQCMLTFFSRRGGRSPQIALLWMHDRKHPGVHWRVGRYYGNKSNVVISMKMSLVTTSLYS